MDDNSNNSNMLCLSSAPDSKWVTQNVRGVMLGIIEEVKGLVTKEADISHINRSDLFTLIQDFNQKHHFLASQCDVLIEILRGNVSATTEDKNSVMLSPKAKGMPKYVGHTISFDSPPNSGRSGSSIQTSLLSSDFETESFTLSDEKHSNSKLDDSDESINEQKLSSSLDMVENMEFEYLVSKIGKYEEEMAALKHDVRNKETENCILSKNLTLVESRYEESEKKIKSLETELKKCESVKAEMKDFYQTQDMEFKSRYAESEKKIKSLENELKKCESIKAEMKDFHQTQATQWHNITQSLKTELNDLNKNFDLQLSEKDDLNAKLQALNADICSKDVQIQEAESELHQLQKQHNELNASFTEIFNEKDELRLKVEELENELKEQAITILDRAEEKREAIRQLCFSLEHYRNGYNEMNKMFIGHRRLAVFVK